ncbi:MTAP protein [Aphelenchoides avenae]|nr:MTAP protein [Aphelenchus avenae]
MDGVAAVIKVGIIGGTGLEDPQILENVKEHRVSTPFGEPSDVIVEGVIRGVPCLLVARHGKRHNISPTNVNYRANLWALRHLGANVIIASTASGSLREELAPGHLVFHDSFIDRTTKREQSFYDGKHIPGVCHVPMHPTFDETLRKILVRCAAALQLTHHPSGTTVVIEGPRFSTRAESELYRSWGASLVNMTLCPEAVLAKELGVPYASVGLVTDYDCWKDDVEHVSIDVVANTLRDNAAKTKLLFIEAVQRIAKSPEIVTAISHAQNVAQNSVMPDGINPVQRV